MGIVTYEWLCGSRPFTGGFGRLVEQHLYEDPPSLRKKNETIPEAIEAVVLKALAKDPRERYVSVQSFARALARASQELPHGQDDDPKRTLPRSASPVPLLEVDEASTFPQIVLSAAPADGTVARHLAADIEAGGISLYMLHPEDVLSAEEQHDTLRQVIRAAQLVLVVLSPNTRSSRTIKDHMLLANLYERRIVFVWTEVWSMSQSGKP